MGLHIKLTGASDPAGHDLVTQKKIFSFTAGPAMRITYVPEPRDRGTKIVFIQVMRELLDGVAVMPSVLDPDFAFQDVDTTLFDMMHVDYVSGEADPYYNGDDAGDKIPQVEARQGNALSTPPRTAHMRDDPNFSDGFMPAGKNSMKWEFRTCAYSADGADAGTFYRFVDWTFEKQRGKASRLRIVGQGADPGTPFKDALNLWCFNHGFVLPTPDPFPPEETLYVVQPGDYLSKIAKSFYGDAGQWPKIYAANKAVIGPNPNLIFPGQELVIPP